MSSILLKKMILKKQSISINPPQFHCQRQPDVSGCICTCVYIYLNIDTYSYRMTQ